MMENLELDRVLEELKQQGIDIQVEATSDELFQIMDGTGNGGCSTGSCSGGSGFRSPDNFSDVEKEVA